MKYFKQLDTLRAFAVILVILSHWFPESFFKAINSGAIGVNIFFVLSGFLITKILFESKISSENSQISKSTVLKTFYIRRTLRIFPIYYLTIFLLLALSKYVHTSLPTSYPYFITYTSNFYFFNHGWDGIVSPYWSLAVEEQFYLLWPWIILLLNKRFFPHIIICFIGIGIISQYFLMGNPMGDILTFTCFDAFGLGALLAWQFIYYPGKDIYKWICIAALLSLIILTACYLFDYWFVPLRTLISLITVWAIAVVIQSKAKNNVVLNNPVFIFLGKISYGLYLYHNMIPSIVSNLITPYINPLLPEWLLNYSTALMLIEETILLVGISWLSFVLVEKKFLNLKKYFEYKKQVPSKVMLQAAP